MLGAYESSQESSPDPSDYDNPMLNNYPSSSDDSSSDPDPSGNNVSGDDDDDDDDWESPEGWDTSTADDYGDFDRGGSRDPETGEELDREFTYTTQQYGEFGVENDEFVSTAGWEPQSEEQEIATANQVEASLMADAGMDPTGNNEEVDQPLGNEGPEGQGEHPPGEAPPGMPFDSGNPAVDRGPPALPPQAGGPQGPPGAPGSDGDGDGDGGSSGGFLGSTGGRVAAAGGAGAVGLGAAWWLGLL